MFTWLSGSWWCGSRAAVAVAVEIDVGIGPGAFIRRKVGFTPRRCRAADGVNLQQSSTRSVKTHDRYRTLRAGQAGRNCGCAVHGRCDRDDSFGALGVIAGTGNCRT